MRRRAVGDDVGDVLNAEYVFLMPGYFGLCLVGRVRFVNYESLITTREDSDIHFVCVWL